MYLSALKRLKCTCQYESNEPKLDQTDRQTPGQMKPNKSL